MNNWWRIAKLELLLLVKDREAVIWSFLAPIGFAWFFGVAFGTPGTPGPTRVRIDAGENPAYVVEIVQGFLQQRDVAIVTGGDPNDGLPTIVLPDSIVHKVTAGNSVAVDIVTEDTGRRSQALSVKMRQVMLALNFRARSAWLDTPPAGEELAAIASSTGPIELVTERLGEAPKTPEGTEHTLPAMLVMFLMFQLMTWYMIQWVEDVKTGKIKRITMSPTPVGQLFAGTLCARFIWALAQIAIILGAGSILLGVRLNIPWGYFAVLIAVYMVAVASIGLLVGSFFKTTEKANAVGVLMTLLFAALGGCWWPLEVVPDTMKTVAMMLPSGLMMRAINGFIAVGSTASFPTVNFLGLVAMVAVIMPIGIARLRRQIIN